MRLEGGANERGEENAVMMRIAFFLSRPIETTEEKNTYSFDPKLGAD
jgi:hypothetical protein